MLFSEQVFQIQHLHRPTVLDYRGRLARVLAGALDLRSWEVDEKQITVKDPRTGDRAIVAINSVSLVYQDASGPEDIEESVRTLFKSYRSVLGSDRNTFNARRIGVRTRSCSSFDGEFTDLRDRLQDNYSTLTDTARRVIDADMVDIGASHDFEDSVGTFRLRVGPVDRSEMTGYFPNRSDYPQAGLYCDSDYRDTEQQEIDLSEVLAFLSSASHTAWNRHLRITDLLT